MSRLMCSGNWSLSLALTQNLWRFEAGSTSNSVWSLTSSSSSSFSPLSSSSTDALKNCSFYLFPIDLCEPLVSIFVGSKTTMYQPHCHILATSTYVGQVDNSFRSHPFQHPIPVTAATSYNSSALFAKPMYFCTSLPDVRTLKTRFQPSFPIIIQLFCYSLNRNTVHCSSGICCRSYRKLTNTLSYMSAFSDLPEYLSILQWHLEWGEFCEWTSEEQFGVMLGRGATDAIFILRQLQEKHLAKNKKLYFAFVDLKAFYRVSRKSSGWPC